MPKQNLLLLGATGFIGSYITSAIVASKDSFGRIVVFTSPITVENKKEKIDALKAQGVEVIVGDIDNEEELLKAYDGITTILSFVGRNAIASQITWINLALKVPSVERFLPSEYGTDIEYNQSSKNEVPHQQKLKVRAALQAQDKLEYTYVVTGPYVEGFISTTPAAPEAGSYNVKAKKAHLVGDGKGKVSVITMPDVGKLTVLALLHPEVSRNRALRVNSFTTTPLEILAEYEKQTGAEKWKVEFTPLDTLKELEKKAYEDGKATATTYTLRRIWGEGGTLYEKRDNGLIEGDETEGLELAVKRAIAVQVGA